MAKKRKPSDKRRGALSGGVGLAKDDSPAARREYAEKRGRWTRRFCANPNCRAPLYAKAWGFWAGKYCNVVCKMRDHRRMQGAQQSDLTLACANCGALMIDKHRGRRKHYCSDSCRAQASKKRRGKK